jgi:hypothetical protein
MLHSKTRARLSDQLLKVHLAEQIEQSDILARLLSQGFLPDAHHGPCEQKT